MKIALSRNVGTVPLKIRIKWLAVAAGCLLVLLIGVMALASPAGISEDFLAGGFVVGLTLLLTGVAVNLYPHLFDVRTFRLPGIFVLAYSAQILLGLPAVYRDYPRHSRTVFLLAATVGFLCTLAGIVLMHYLFPSSPSHVRRWLSAPLRTTSVLRLFSVVFLIVCGGIFVLYIRQVGTLPIIQALRGGSATAELTLARELALKLIPGHIRYLYGFLREVLFPYTTLLLLSIAMTRRGWRWKLLFALSFLLNGLLAAATLAKSPVAALLIMLVCAWLMLRGRTLSMRQMIPLAIAVLAFPVFVIFLTYRFDIEPVRVVNAIGSRLFYAPTQVLFHYIDYFPGQHDFLLGRTLPQISRLFRGGPFPITFTICHYMYPDWPESCSANGAYLGYLWADFGWMGVILGGLLSGVILQGWQALNLRLPKSAPTVALQALLVYNTIMLASVSLFDSLLSIGGGLVDIIALTVLLALISGPTRPRKPGASAAKVD